MMPAGTQGSKEPVDVLGDLVIDLDEDFQVAGSGTRSIISISSAHRWAMKNARVARAAVVAHRSFWQRRPMGGSTATR